MHWTRYTKAVNICQPWLSLLPDKLQYPCHFKGVYYFLVKSKGGNITDERRLVRHFKPGCINPVKKEADEFQNRALESFVLWMHRKLMGFLSCFTPLPCSPEPPAWLTQNSINHSMPFIYLSALSSELVTHQPLAKAVHESSMEDIAKQMQWEGGEGGQQSCLYSPISLCLWWCLAKPSSDLPSDLSSLIGSCKIWVLTLEKLCYLS